MGSAHLTRYLRVGDAGFLPSKLHITPRFGDIIAKKIETKQILQHTPFFI
jgi:hypothetical protein